MFRAAAQSGLASIFLGAIILSACQPLASGGTSGVESRWTRRREIVAS